MENKVMSSMKGVLQLLSDPVSYSLRWRKIPRLCIVFTSLWFTDNTKSPTQRNVSHRILIIFQAASRFKTALKRECNPKNQFVIDLELPLLYICTKNVVATSCTHGSWLFQLFLTCSEKIGKQSKMHPEWICFFRSNVYWNSFKTFWWFSTGTKH